MVFKLVRVDAEEANKIKLPIGTHLIGRGSCLDCNDKRISRNHGNLIVTEDSLFIEALHQNPCFFTRKGTKDTEVLKKSCKELLQNGDRFGLLPGSYWYEVLECSADTDSQATDVSYTQEQVNSEPKETSNIESDKQNDGHENDKTNNIEANEQEDAQNDSLLNRDTTKVMSNSHVGIEENSELLDFDLNETVENLERAESPSLLDKDQQEEAKVNQPAVEPEASLDTTVEEPQTDIPLAQMSSPVQQPSSPSPKRSHSPDATEGAKKVKTEPIDIKTDPVGVKTEPVTVKQEPDVRPGPSNDQAGASNGAGDASKAPPSPVKPPNRERCLYGANCYRRNPQHKAQFSHPTDVDWGSGERAACPYGAACRKRDPRHWQIHDHPPNTRPPPPVQRTKPKPRKQRDESDSDDQSHSQSPSCLIVQGKRPRKPIPKDSPGSESEPEDPFHSDGSEDWEPPTDYTESQDF